MENFENGNPNINLEEDSREFSKNENIIIEAAEQNESSSKISSNKDNNIIVNSDDENSKDNNEDITIENTTDNLNLNNNINKDKDFENNSNEVESSSSLSSSKNDYFQNNNNDFADEEKTREIKEVFNVFDKDCDGFITTDELATVMRTLGHNPTKEELDELIKQYDQDESGTIDFNEFMNLMNNKLKEQQEGQELLETFQMFDKDADGYINADDIRYVRDEVDEKLDDVLIDELIEQGDRDGDKKINYHEFVRIMTSK